MSDSYHIRVGSQPSPKQARLGLIEHAALEVSRLEQALTLARNRLADAIRAAYPVETQTDLARAAGLSHQRVSQILRETR